MTAVISTFLNINICSAGDRSLGLSYITQFYGTHFILTRATA